MMKEGNIWAELWGRATPVPADAQPPLYDPEIEGGAAVQSLADMSPPEIFEQLFATALGCGYAALSASPAAARFADGISDAVQQAGGDLAAAAGGDAEARERLCEVYGTLEELAAYEGQAGTDEDASWTVL